MNEKELKLGSFVYRMRQHAKIQWFWILETPDTMSFAKAVISDEE